MLDSAGRQQRHRHTNSPRLAKESVFCHEWTFLRVVLELRNDVAESPAATDFGVNRKSPHAESHWVFRCTGYRPSGVKTAELALQREECQVWPSALRKAPRAASAADSATLIGSFCAPHQVSAWTAAATVHPAANLILVRASEACCALFSFAATTAILLRTEQPEGHEETSCTKDDVACIHGIMPRVFGAACAAAFAFWRFVPCFPFSSFGFFFRHNEIGRAHV